MSQYKHTYGTSLNQKQGIRFEEAIQNYLCSSSQYRKATIEENKNEKWDVMRLRDSKKFDIKEKKNWCFEIQEKGKTGKDLIGKADYYIWHNLTESKIYVIDKVKLIEELKQEIQNINPIWNEENKRYSIKGSQKFNVLIPKNLPHSVLVFVPDEWIQPFIITTLKFPQ